MGESSWLLRKCSVALQLRHWQEANGNGQHVSDGGSAQDLLSPRLSHHHWVEVWMLPVAAQAGERHCPIGFMLKLHKGTEHNEQLILKVRKLFISVSP